jgi:protein-S-isoprenylcysteine O-methyltransferase Ste14
MSPRATAWWLVVTQFGLIGSVALLPGEHWRVTGAHDVVAVALIITALVLGLWAARWLGRGLTPLPLPNGQVGLITGGPYRWVRHPMYSAVMLGMGGVALRSGSWWSAGAWVALVVLFSFKSRWEERHLEVAFPGYENYRERTGRFVPRSQP